MFIKMIYQSQNRLWRKEDSMHNIYIDILSLVINTAKLVEDIATKIYDKIVER